MAWLFGGKKFGEYTYEHWFDHEYDDIYEKNCSIRKMLISDYEAVYSLWLNTSKLGLNNIDDSKEGIEKYLARNPHTCFIAEKDQKIIAAILSGHDGRRAFIYHLAVAAEERRQGIGTELVKRAIEALESEGITKAALVVFKNNEEGNSFWEKLGFNAREDLTYRNLSIKELQRIDT